MERIYINTTNQKKGLGCFCTARLKCDKYDTKHCKFTHILLPFTTVQKLYAMLKDIMS